MTTIMVLPAPAPSPEGGARGGRPNGSNAALGGFAARLDAEVGRQGVTVGQVVRAAAAELDTARADQPGAVVVDLATHLAARLASPHAADGVPGEGADGEPGEDSADVTGPSERQDLTPAADDAALPGAVVAPSVVAPSVGAAEAAASAAIGSSSAAGLADASGQPGGAASGGSPAGSPGATGKTETAAPGPTAGATTAAPGTTPAGTHAPGATVAVEGDDLGHAAPSAPAHQPTTAVGAATHPSPDAVVAPSPTGAATANATSGTPPSAGQTAVPANLTEQLSGHLGARLQTLRAAGPGEHVLTLRVDPESFGPVRVVAHIGHDAVRIELIGASEAARDALRAALPDLRRDLAGAGLGNQLDLGTGEGGQDRLPGGRPAPGTSDAPSAPAAEGAVAAPTDVRTALGGLDLLA